MENELCKAYAEVDEILALMESEYIEKIPKNIRDMFKTERASGYNPVIQVNIPLDKQMLQRKTFAILALLNLNYWCEDEVERQKLIEIYAENDKQREAELREIYNKDNLFKNRQEKDQIDNNSKLMKIDDENIIRRIIRKIMKFFKK